MLINWTKVHPHSLASGENGHSHAHVHCLPPVLREASLSMRPLQRLPLLPAWTPPYPWSGMQRARGLGSGQPWLRVYLALGPLFWSSGFCPISEAVPYSCLLEPGTLGPEPTQ